MDSLYGSVGSRSVSALPTSVLLRNGRQAGGADRSGRKAHSRESRLDKEDRQLSAVTLTG